jgi:hypothetical protein
VDLQDIIRTQTVHEFLKGMQDRLVQGYHTYGHWKDSCMIANSLKCAKDRIAKYEADGNTEWLLDAGNFLMFEFGMPNHPDAHFRATSEDESPGVLDDSGKRCTATAHRSKLANLKS